MKKLLFLFVFFACNSPQNTIVESTEWEVLFDQELSNWDTYLSFSFPNGYNGETPLDENRNAMIPLGLNYDPYEVFTMITEQGEDVMQVSGQYYGALISKLEYENYRFKVKVRWGEKKWSPRKDLLKDAGLIYHSIGEPGVDYWQSWMLGQELQFMEGHFGDYWTISDAAIDVKALIPEDVMTPIANESRPYFSLGAGTENGGFCLRSEDFESPPGEWTEIELITFDGNSLHLVNGEVVMVLSNSRYLKDGELVPLQKGKLQLQSEACEVFYKDAMILEIDELPEDYLKVF